VKPNTARAAANTARGAGASCAGLAWAAALGLHALAAGARALPAFISSDATAAVTLFWLRLTIETLTFHLALLLALIALGIALALYLLARSSDTGSIDSPFAPKQRAPTLAPGAADAIPKP
jgi:hypothetical protein